MLHIHEYNFCFWLFVACVFLFSLPSKIIESSKNKAHQFALFTVRLKLERYIHLLA